jgi:hypothetical protein
MLHSYSTLESYRPNALCFWRVMGFRKSNNLPNLYFVNRVRRVRVDTFFRNLWHDEGTGKLSRSRFRYSKGVSNIPRTKVESSVGGLALPRPHGN